MEDVLAFRIYGVPMEFGRFRGIAHRSDPFLGAQRIKEPIERFEEEIGKGNAYAAMRLLQESAKTYNQPSWDIMSPVGEEFRSNTVMPIVVKHLQGWVSENGAKSFSNFANVVKTLKVTREEATSTYKDPYTHTEIHIDLSEIVGMVMARLGSGNANYDAFILASAIAMALDFRSGIGNGDIAIDKSVIIAGAEMFISQGSDMAGAFHAAELEYSFGLREKKPDKDDYVNMSGLARGSTGTVTKGGFPDRKRDELENAA